MFVSQKIRFTIPGRSQSSLRTGGNGKFRFTPKKVRDSMGYVRDLAVRAMDGILPLEGPIGLELKFVYVQPDSWPKKRKAETFWKTSKPDTDNLEKLVKDACNTIVWKDDAQVCDVQVSKFYGDRDETRVVVRTLNPNGGPEA